MAEDGIVNQISEDTQNFWGNMDNKQKLMFSAFAVILIAVCAFLISFVFKPHYQVLYTELDQSDAAAIGSYLEKSGVAYQVAGDGKTIGVSNSSVPKLRLELASKGLPKGSGVGFEIFDKPNITVTDFGQKLNYHRALEGELSRTISSLDTVKQAKVHLAMAKKSLFKNKTQENSASVIIVPTFGAELTAEQVKGIRHLVASAINDLEPNHVQITDSTGRSLVEFDDPTTLIAKQVIKNKQAHRDFEATLEKNLLNLLEPIIGQGSVLVNVTAKMNFDESEMNIEVYSPKIDDKDKEPVIRSEQISRETYKKNREAAGGVPGTQNNIPTFAGSKANQDGKNKDYVKEDIVKNYEVSRTVERVKKASGVISKLSVAVVINKDLNPAERATLRKTVVVASGLDMERGDQVVITGIRFASTPELKDSSEKAQKKFESMTNLSLVKKLGALAISILLAFMLIISLIASMKNPLSTAKTSKLDELLREEDLPLLDTINKKLLERGGGGGGMGEGGIEEIGDLGQMRQHLSKTAAEDPENVTKALRAFIDE